MIRFLRKHILKISANNICLLSLLFLFISGTVVFSEDIDEDALFSGDDTFIESGQNLKEDVDLFLEKESMAFSGRLLARGIFAMNRDWLLEDGDWDENALSNYSEADFFLDVRLKKGVKGFVNLGIENAAQDQAYLVSDPGADPEEEAEDDFEETLKEFFIDANANRKVYFRIGKQVLKWGRTYFWNPTDFINIEKREFLDMYRYREGVYGARVHVPFGARQNIYMFMNCSEADNADDVGAAFKYEFLIKNTEASFSSYIKRHVGHAFGVDISYRLLGVDVNSEVSFFNEDHHLYVDIMDGSPLIMEDEDKGSLRLSIGIAKTFDYKLNDRISLIYEFFYNEAGYDKNIFKNDAAVLLLFFNDEDEILYEPNYHGRFYSALFFSIDKYPVPDMMINLSALNNMSDRSFVLVPGLSYSPVDHFTLTFNINIFAGPEKAEYTYEGTAVAADLSVEIEF